MLLHWLLGVSLLVTQWNTATAFCPRVLLPLQRSQGDHSKHDKRPPGRTLYAGANPDITDLPPQPERDPIPRPGSSSSRPIFPWALPTTASGIRAYARRGNAADVAEDAMCGGISLTRTDLMSVALAVAAGVALGPRRALAAVESTAEPPMGVNGEMALGRRDSIGGTVEVAKYTVGTDEVRMKP